MLRVVGERVGVVRGVVGMRERVGMGNRGRRGGRELDADEGDVAVRSEDWRSVRDGGGERGYGRRRRESVLESCC